MSPASRWSRNCTPFTTRPSFTSRQGMILRAGKADRLFERDLALPQSSTDDRTGGRQPREVSKRRNATRPLDGRVGQAARNLLIETHVRPLEHSVAADVGDEKVPRVRIQGRD